MDVRLDLLAKAIAKLEESLEYANSDLAKSDPKLFEHLRSGAIQSFEYTYELSHKTLKRFLLATSADSDRIDTASFQGLIRLANQRGLLRSDWLTWKRYKDIRNLATHTYDEDNADAVYQVIPDFLVEAKVLLEKLTTEMSKL